MSKPARYTKGVSTAQAGPLVELPCPDPTKLHLYFNDFDHYTAADWTVTLIGAGGTAALGDADGGVLVLTTDTLDDDQVTLQKLGESFLLESGKKAFFKARFKVADATQADFQIGLVVTDTTPLDATDGIYFQKDDGDALLDVYCRKNATTGSTSATGVHTVVNDTYLTVGWMYDGVSELKYFVNDIHKGTLSAAAAYLPDTELTVSMSYKNGEAGAIAMTVDYILAAKER
jgi:hypothetical protein